MEKQKLVQFSSCAKLSVHNMTNKVCGVYVDRLRVCTTQNFHLFVTSKQSIKEHIKLEAPQKKDPRSDGPMNA